MNVKLVLALVLSCFVFPSVSLADSDYWKPKRVTLLHVSYSSGALEATYTLRSGDVLHVIQDEIIIAEISTCDPIKMVTLKAPADATLSRNREEDSTVFTPSKSTQLWLEYDDTKTALPFAKRNPITTQLISFGSKCSAEEIW